MRVDGSSPQMTDVGKTTTLQLNNLELGRYYQFSLTAYNTAGLESDPSSTVGYSPQPPPPPPTFTSSAVYVRNQRSIGGSWKGVFGKDGGASYLNNLLLPPDYVRINGYQNFPLTWNTGTQDYRAIQPRAGTNRVAGAWYNSELMSFYLRFNSGMEHQVSFYFLDYDRQGREQYVEFYDLDSGEIFGGEYISNFGNGYYSTWNLRGNVGIRVNRLKGASCVLSGMFFDQLPGASAALVERDAETRGSWIGKYGSDGGLAIPYGTLVPPNYLKINAFRNYPLIWEEDTSDLRALQKPGSISRVASAWHATNEMFFYLQYSDDDVRQLSFYFADYDRAQRAQKLELFDMDTGNRLISETLTNFSNGIYLTYNVAGRIGMKLTRLSGPNVVLNGLFFDPPLANLAEFYDSDTSSAGSWKGTFGGVGHAIASEEFNLPPFASLSIHTDDLRIFSKGSLNPVALQRPTGYGGVAAVWKADKQFNVDLDCSDSNWHKVSLYFADYDGRSRQQLVEVLDGVTGRLLDRIHLSEFGSGVWITYNLTGKVTFRITALDYNEPYLSGIFFDS
jgi:hypothetical protein